MSTLASAMFANAQTMYPIYDGANPSTSFIGSVYSFDGITASIDTVQMNPVQTEIKATGITSGYYIGGIGAAKFTGPDQKAAISDFDGTVAGTTVNFSAATDTSVLKIKFQFKTGVKTFGYEYDFGGAVATLSDFSFAMEDVKEVVNDNPTGDVITDEEMLAIDEFQWVVICTANDGVCGANLTIKNMISSFPNPTSDVVTFSQELSNITVFDMKGNIVDTFVAAKAINVSNYQAGLYYISSAEYNTKVVVK